MIDQFAPGPREFVCRRIVAACLSLLWWGGLVGTPATGIAAAKDAVVWIERYDEAIAEARRTGKPIFLEFRCAP